MDTDLLLALLESSLPKATNHSQADLLNALIDAGGDVSRAVDALTRRGSVAPSPTRPSPLKRKTDGDIEAWLIGKRRKTDGLKYKEKEDTRFPGASSSTMRPPNSKGSAASSSTRTSPAEMPSLLAMLKQASSPKKPATLRLPPLMLASPEAVAKHTPTNLHPSILPAELACRLYYGLLDEAEKWTKGRWYIAQRWVESSHTGAFYARRPEALQDNGMRVTTDLWYNGRPTGAPKLFTDEMEEALLYIEPVVREQMSKRKRFPLEWGGSSGGWFANVAAVNCYRGSQEGVGPHADTLTYLGPHPTIVSLTLGTTRSFRLREVIPIAEADQRQARTFDIPLPHNSLLIMHPPTQEIFKHSVPTMKSIDSFRPAFPRRPGEEISNHIERINITFRFFRPDFAPASIPKCRCPGDIPTKLKSNMKRRKAGEPASFFWQCDGGGQNDSEGCHLWKEMDAKAEGRGPFLTM